MSASSKPTPIAIPNDLAANIDEVSTLTGLSKQDVMRLCMRIGLVDLKAAEHDIPGSIQQNAHDQGMSFQRFAQAQRLLNAPQLTPARSGVAILNDAAATCPATTPAAVTYHAKPRAKR